MRGLSSANRKESAPVGSQLPHNSDLLFLVPTPKSSASAPSQFMMPEHNSLLPNSLRYHLKLTSISPRKY